MRGHAGFSLLEVLVAVSLLAIGLLALAALQGALARGAADATVRARVMGVLAGELDALRATPFAEIASLVAPIDASGADCASPGNAVEHAACDAGIRGLRVHRNVANVGATLRSVQVSAEWSAATGETRTLALHTLLGELALEPNRLHAVAAEPMSAQVRGAISEWLSPGAVPIAMGEGSGTATTLPVPVMMRGEEVGTRFDVLRFEEVGEQARLDARIEMQFVKCRCRYGAGGAPLGPVHSTARWPAVWNGYRYAMYAPDDGSVATGNRYAAGPMSEVAQSAQCRECCRDRHDNAGASHPKFDPFARDVRYRKYDLDPEGALVEVADTARGTYVDSCRLVRVDGWWRTAADVQARQFGLLQTASVDGVPAASPRPDDEAMTRYTQFIHDTLADPEGDAQALHDRPASGLNLPPRIAMRAPPASDLRHLHARALYIDALEPEARAVMDAACARGSPRHSECVRPFLPFFTLDLTDLANWSAQDPAVLAVDRGRVRALAAGASDALVAARTSNSGIARGAGVPGATDRQGDDAVLTDAQSFEISGSGAERIDAAPRGQPKYATPPE